MTRRPPDPEARRRWAAAFTARAADWWTDSRRHALLGDLHLLLPPVEAAPLLRALRLLNGDGSMPPESVRKYMQISHLALLLEPLYVKLAAEHPRLHLLDLGCGSSYLTLALAWCFRRRWNHPVRILGVDRDPVVLRRCRNAAALAGLEDDLRFLEGGIGEIDPPAAWERAFGPDPAGPIRTQVLVALHACDTATDESLALGVAHRVELLAVAPCCQAELARVWGDRAAAGEEGPFAPVWGAPHLRRRIAADLTDALRALLLAAHGWQVTPMEFVSAAHTPKNTLLRAVRTGCPDPDALRRYRALRDAVGAGDLHLARRLGAVVGAALPTT